MATYLLFYLNFKLNFHKNKKYYNVYLKKTHTGN